MSGGNIHARAALNDGNNLTEQQIEAVLALAYEQRTANLIAFLQPVQCGDDKIIYAHATSAVKTLDAIAERLGVSPDGKVDNK